MISYGGTYTFDGYSVDHRMDTSWNECFTGTTVTRGAAWEGEQLVFASPAAPFSGDGKMSTGKLIWEKVQ